MGEASNIEPLKFNLSDLNEDMLHTILELVSDGIWDWNANTGFVYRNPGWYEMLGYPPHSLNNNVLTWENVIHPDDYPQVMALFDDYLSERAPGYQAEYRCRMQDGSYTWIEDRGYVLARNADGSVARMVGAHRSIDDKKRLYEALERRNQSLEAIVEERTRELSRVNQQLQIQLEENRKLAETDSLTSIANRYLLEKALPQECERAQRFRQPLSLIAMDIDDFKNINDHYGHALGDAALVRVVDSVKHCVREGDLLARWGGDEFILILPNTPLADARALAERIRHGLASLLPVGDFPVTMSFGVVQRFDEEQQTGLLARADQALYRSKIAGKNVISG
ncbi:MULTISPECIES: sensor domain-containing diguanylate cyclase [unclassified Pseudomonas]|uniref:sensor domain-containing diguanylate cyclase n=1 Tax=unclassified Pseudomonas TaxID=196821 RepID=UPI000C8768AC|nr:MULTISPECIES: sensor domain-containing diguanylate cyclase [unclassified Pseudomonas]PMU12350.1 diguanylate cyclase [Pseudomonas sp. FW305-20]PMU19645.1 diguanylate cyclase [Pseudomonas sp. FW305-122]PMU42657.1 diguanylate cyclase [Pseudomonas sp. FW305-47B]PMX62229.1 diguanylate cyclase [Pseudomonas sp. FW305-33]PMX69888.1 diguanylate cyclase [Pseudomonas sp. FW305-60]